MILCGQIQGNPEITGIRTSRTSQYGRKIIGKEEQEEGLCLSRPVVGSGRGGWSFFDTDVTGTACV